MASLIRFMLLGVTVFTVLHTVDAFMCHQKEFSDESSTYVPCPSGTCFSIGGGVGENTAAKKGCADKSYEEGCVNTGVPGFISGHVCYCNFPFCNNAFTPNVVLPLLVLPALLHYLL